MLNWAVFGDFLQTALPIGVMLAVLVWGLRIVSAALKPDPEDDDGGDVRLGASFLREKATTRSSTTMKALASVERTGGQAVTLTPEQLDRIKEEVQQDISFSRVAGSIGAVAMAAFFAGLGVWSFFAINDTTLYPAGGDLNEQVSLISRISELGTFFAAGSALFLPYAFNRISTIFK